MTSPPPTENDPTDAAEPDEPSPEFGSALADFEQRPDSAPAAEASATRELKVGEKLKGRVVSIGDEHAMVDYGGRSEALVELKHFRTEDDTLKIAVGDTPELFVVESGDRVLLAPHVKAEGKGAAARRQMREAQTAGMPVTGRVTGVNPGGLTVDVGGARAFCPLSQIEAGFCSDPSVYVGRTLPFLVTKAEESRGGIVLSRRALLRKEEEEKAKTLLATLKVGDEREGRVARIEPFGAFVDLGGIDGLVHVSEIRHERTGDPRSVLNEGETVRVRVLSIGPGKQGRPRIALSIKAATPDPWTGLEQRIAPGAHVHGIVARIAEFGAFITVEPGVDGLVHISEVAPQRVEKIRDVLSAGQSVEAVVLAVDPARRRLSLSIKQASPEYNASSARGERGAPEMTGEPQAEGARGAPRGGFRGGPFSGAPFGAGREGGREGGRRDRRDRDAGRGGAGSVAGGSGRGGRGGRNRGDREGGHETEGSFEHERESRRERTETRASSPPPSNEPTTLGLALRKAMEEAERKQRQGG
jgi:small subunit ribosomal protein S1